jgi:PrtD family type I secretion system ABC transporter
LVILALHPWLGIIAIGAAVILFVLALINEMAARRPLKEANRLAIGNTYAVDAALRNAEAVQAMGMLPNFIDRHATDTDESLRQLVRAGDRNATMVGIAKALRVLIQILILGAGAFLVLAGELTAGGMIAASILLGRALAPIEQMIGVWKQMVAGRDAWGRLKTLLRTLPPDQKPMNLPAPKGVVSCEQVGYAVPQREQPILMGIDFTVEPGQALGIVGPSAAGKSSLCKILVGAWKPTRGHARLDGGDVSLWDPSRLGKYIGYLPQDVELFSGTVKDNIARLSPQLDEAAVIEAAMAADVHDMILALPKGYDTDIGEDGAFLSGGQRQRIGLARAFYGKPKLIVLDEPAASLDSRGEEALLRAIDTAKGWGSTVVMVAHKLRLLRSADKLLLLHEGQQQAFGPKDDIIGQLRLVRPATAADTPSLVAAKPEASG